MIQTLGKETELTQIEKLKRSSPNHSEDDNVVVFSDHGEDNNNLAYQIPVTALDNGEDESEYLLFFFRLHMNRLNHRFFFTFAL